MNTFFAVPVYRVGNLGGLKLCTVKRVIVMQATYMSLDVFPTKCFLFILKNDHLSVLLMIKSILFNLQKEDVENALRHRDMNMDEALDLLDIARRQNIESWRGRHDDHYDHQQFPSQRYPSGPSSQMGFPHVSVSKLLSLGKTKYGEYLQLD